MQNLFADPNNDQSGPFSEVNLTPAEAPLDSTAAIRQSRLMATASLDPSIDRVMTQYRELQALYEQGINSAQEERQRLKIADEERQRRMGLLQELATTDVQTDPTGELRKGAELALQQAEQESVERKARVATERAAAERLLDLASREPEQARVIQYLYERGNVVDQALDYATKSFIIARGIERAQAELADQGWFRHVVDFGMTFLPLKASMGNTGNFDAPGYENWAANLFSQVFSGRRTRAEVASLWSLSAEDFAEVYEKVYLPNVLDNSTFLGYKNNSQQLEILSQMQQTKSAFEINMNNTLDNIGIIGGVATLGGRLGIKATSSLAASALRLGGRKTAANIYAHAAQVAAKDTTTEAVNRAGVNTMDELVDSMATGMVRQEIQPLHAVSPQAIINGYLDEARELLGKLPSWLQPGRFSSADEFQNALEAFVEKESRRFDKRIVDVEKPIKVSTADGSSVTQVEFTLGRTDGTGFMKESSAKNYAKGLGFDDARVVQSEDGTYFVKVRRTMTENGVYTNELRVQTRGPIARFFANARVRSDKKLADAATLADHARNRIINKVIPTLAKDLKVDPMSRERLTNLWRAGDNEGVWWTREQANSLYQRTYNRDISDKEWKAYNALRKVNDVEYLIRNDLLWKEKAIRGVETVSADLGPIGNLNRVNAIVDEDLTKPMHGRIIRADDGVSWDDAIPAEDLQRMKDDGYVAVHLEDSQRDWLHDGYEFDVVLIKPENFKRSNLDPRQIPYRPGGHRFYEDDYYAKQTRMGTRADGSKYLKRPKVYIVGTKAEVDEWTSTMEKLRLAVKENPNISPAALDDIVDGRVGYPSGREFLEGLKNGDYDLNHSFKTYFDREMPEEYHRSPNPFSESAESGFEGLMKTTGRMYYSRKGDALPDFRGQRAITLDPWRAANKSLINIANMSSFSDYKLQAVQRWYNTFSKYLEPNPALSTPMQYFMHGKVNKLAAQDGVVHAIEDQRLIVRRNLGWKTEGDLRAQEFQRNIAEWVMGKDPNSIRHGASRAVINFMEDKNPISFMRGLAFDLKLGMFNPAQLFLQANTYLAMAAIDPAGAARGLQSVSLLRGFLSFKGNLDEFKKVNTYQAKKYGFDSREEMSAYLESARRSGFFDINESHTMINAMGPNSAFNITGNKLNDLRQASRFFFNQGELFNRAVAYRAAWRSEWEKAGKGGVDWNDPLVQSRVIGRAEDLSMSMSRTSQAWWQQGITSIPTQFWSYQVRMLEAMLGGFTGKGAFSRAEAWRLIISQIFLYGSAGIPMGSVISDYIAKQNGEATQLNTLPGFIDRGLLDTLWYNITGGEDGGSDVLISERFGTGGWLAETVESLFGISRFGDVTPMDILGGPTWSISADLMEDIGPVLKYISAESGADQGMPFTERALMSLAKNITTVSNAHKAYMIMQYGYLRSNNNNFQFNDLPPATALTTLLLGAQPGQQRDLDAMAGFEQDRSKHIKEAAKVVTQYRQEMLNHPERVEELSEEINLYMQMFDHETRREILDNVFKVQDRSMYDAHARRREERRQREAFLEGSK